MERQARQQGITELLQRVLPRAFLACLAVCLGSGILLLFQYRPFGDVFANVEEISSLAPFGFFFRRLHYFSGQGCTALALLHMLEHCLRGSYHRMSVPAWIRLGASLVVCFGLLFTGFILKADQEALQAASILESLAGSVPLAGGALSRLVSAPDPWRFMPAYILHCIVLPPLLALFLRKHAKRPLPGAEVTAWTVLVLCALALLAPLPLSVPPAALEAEVHGPWFFHVLQKALRWAPPLVVSALLLVIPAGLFCVLPRLSGSLGRIVRTFLAVMFGLYAGLTILLTTVGGG